MTAIVFTLVDPQNQFAASYQGILASANQAAAQWAGLIQGPASLEINIEFSNNLGGAAATGGPATNVLRGLENGNRVFYDGPVAEILSGTDPNGGAADGTITVSTTILNDFSNGQTNSRLFAHELGHILGFIGLVEDDVKPTGADGVPQVTTYDLNKVFTPNAAFITGPNVLLVNGAPVPLAARNNTSHLGIVDLMAPNASAEGISAIDIAIGQDFGLPIATDRADFITLGTGNNIFDGGAGNDTVSAGDGNDTIVGGLGDDAIVLGSGNDFGLGNQGNDFVLGNQGDDIVVGGQGNDIVVGGQGSDFVYGNEGNDFAYGNEGSDTLIGGQGDDTIVGGQGDDVIYGNEGNDTIFGNEGADRLVFGTNSGLDVVNGFAASEGDRLDLMGQTFVLTQDAQGSAVLTLSGGGVVTLTNVGSAQVGAGTFV